MDRLWLKVASTGKEVCLLYHDPEHQSDDELVFEAVDDWLDQNHLDLATTSLIQSLVQLSSQKDPKSAIRWAKAAEQQADHSKQERHLLWARKLQGFGYSLEGYEYERLGERHKAIASYKSALSLVPDYAYPWIELGRLMNEMGCQSEAIQYLNKALQIENTNQSAWSNLIRAHIRQGNIDHAQRALHEAKLIGVDGPKLDLEQAAIESARGAHGQAISSYKRAISRETHEPFVAYYWNLLGCELKKWDQYDSAADAFRTAAMKGNRAGLLNLVDLHYQQGEFHSAAFEFCRLLNREIDSVKSIPYKVARDFRDIRKRRLRYDCDLIEALGLGEAPGSGKHIVDKYLSVVQQALINALVASEIEPEKAALDLYHLAVLWCNYGQRCCEKGLSSGFAREQLYTLEYLFMTVPAHIQAAVGFSSAIEELKVRVGGTSPDEFARQMLRLEGPWLESAGYRQKRGDVQDLRFRLKGNLWVHLYEYQQEQQQDHLERIHYYMELLKGHTLLHKLADPIRIKTDDDKFRWNRYVESLPVKVEHTAIVDLSSCIRSLPTNSIGLSYFFLRRELLPELMLVVIFEPEKKLQLRILESAELREQYRTAADRLKHVHDQVAWRPKTERTGEVFCELTSQQEILRGRSLTKAVVHWEKNQLHQAYEAVLDGVIGIDKLRGKDVYISPASEMYDIPFGLLFTGDEFLNTVANSITIVPAFSLQRFRRLLSPLEEDIVLCLDKDWEDEAILRGRFLSRRAMDSTRHWIESDLLNFQGDSHAKYGRWIEGLKERRKAHIIGHQDAYQWSYPQEERPNLGQFGRFLYDHPDILNVDYMALEACWGGTWAEPEDLMGLFVSFLARGVTSAIASPYSLVPGQTSNRLFEQIYRTMPEGSINSLHLACCVREAAMAVSAGSQSIEDTIPTLWGALQVYSIVGDEPSSED